jgi:hypothetical protein
MATTFFSVATHERDRTKLPVLAGYMLCDQTGFWCWVLNASFHMKRWTFSRFSKVPDIDADDPDESHDISCARNLQLHRNFMGIHGAAVVAFDTPTDALQFHIVGKNNVEIAMQWVSNLSQRITWAQEEKEREASTAVEEVGGDGRGDDAAAAGARTAVEEPVSERTADASVEPEPLPHLQSQRDLGPCLELTVDPNATPEPEATPDEQQQQQQVDDGGGDGREEMTAAAVPEQLATRAAAPGLAATSGASGGGVALKQASGLTAARRVSSVSSLLRSRSSSSSARAPPPDSQAVVYTKQPKAVPSKRELQPASAKTFDFSF